MSFASLYFEILKGGPFDGLPALCLRFQDEEDELDLGSVVQIMSALRPPPMHLRVLYVAGNPVPEDLVRVLGLATSYGMATSCETYGDVLPWMFQTGWRCLHTSDECIASPVEEIVFHTEEVPHLVPFPFHEAKRPLLWWAPPRGIDNIFEKIPQGMRLWTPRKTVEKKIFPKEAI